MVLMMLDWGGRMFLAALILKGLPMDEPSQKLENEKGFTVMLLKPQERLVCEQLAAGQFPYSQRALSLLALDAGATQTAAAQQSGQTVGQVRYWLGKFQDSRLGIFPEDLLPQSEPQLLPSQGLPDQPTVPEALDLDQPVKQAAVEEKTKDAAAEAGAEAELEKKAKTKKKSKKVMASKRTAKRTTKKAKKEKESGKKRKEKKDKKGKKKQGKKKPTGKKTGKRKKKGKK